MQNDTICALATANGIGAIGIIRVSGEKSIEIVNKVFDGKNLAKAASHTIHYGFVVDRSLKMEGEERFPEDSNLPEIATAESQKLKTESEIIDEVMVSVFHAPKTFTTENSVEISFHGSPHIAKKILEVLIKNGARMAKAGEFTMRAFMNGRIDLSQAESIADLISSENEASRKVALNQLKGGISDEISLLRNDLLNFTSLIELELDFAEEDVEFADRTALNNLIQNLKTKIQNLLDSFQYGNALKNGVAVSIIGKPNAGKSTLLNALLKEERAIVSEIAGTTRDTIEEILHIKGNAFRLIDTAGLRETEDQIEAIGVAKAKEKVENADVLVYLIDSNSTHITEDVSLLKELMREDLKTIICITKSETIVTGNVCVTAPSETEGKESIQYLTETLNFHLPSSSFELLEISAKENHNLDLLKNELSSYVENLKSEESNVVITNQRHYEALQKSLESVQKVEDAVHRKISTELLAYELRNTLEHLGEISGEFTNDEVLGNIFSKFCIGK